jgi:hypothetical protein
MVEVEDLNHYGVGLFDFCVGSISFLARLTARSKGMGARAFRPLHSSFHELSFWIFRNYKDRFSNHRFDVCKDNYLLEIIFAMLHFLFRSCLRTRGWARGKGVPPFAFLMI